MKFPVEEKLGEIRAALAAGRDVVLTAPPGSGKTTCVPPALLAEPWLKGKKIVMLEPRRLAARNCATYIAAQLGESVGDTVGYQVRLERKIGRNTRLEIVTEGLLAQRIMSDPELAEVGLVIFDEFHERSLPCDLAFALALDVQRGLRPDLRIMIMSATIDAESLVDSWSRAIDGSREQSKTVAGNREQSIAVVNAEGRMFPVATRYLGEVSMAAAVSRALAETDGDILCFLPGEGEIRRTQESLLGVAAEVLPLYGALPKAEQDRVFSTHSAAVRRVILATSIAETSLTLPGITAVVDSGLMRVPRFSPGTGMTGLVTLPLTLDRAEQRRGRAGRVQAGVCYRLWSEASAASRPQKMMPEILDADLSSLVLTSCAWGALKREDLPWMTLPPASAWEQAMALLKLLGAVDVSVDACRPHAATSLAGAAIRLTDKGREMAKLPMHPRLANMLLGAVEGRRVQSRAIDKASLLAAIIEEGGRSRETDIRKVLDEVLETPNRPASKRILQLAQRFRRQSTAIEGNREQSRAAEIDRDRVQSSAIEDEGLLLALAYPDRIAKNRGNGSFCMVSGRGIAVDSSDPLAKTEFIVGCSLDDRLGDAKLFLGCPLAEDSLLKLVGDGNRRQSTAIDSDRGSSTAIDGNRLRSTAIDLRIVDEPCCEWDRRNERVKAVIQRRLGAITLSEVPVAPEAAQGGEQMRILAAIPVAMTEGVRIKGVDNLPGWTKETLQLRARIRFLARHLPDAQWPAVTDAELLAALPGFVGGMTRWRDLERLDLAAVMDFLLSEAGHDRRELDRLAPVRMEVPSGSHMVIHYEGEEPTVEVRLQECFGLMETPRVAGGKVPIVMTLLSPAQRPIQITKDLAGFWRGAYQLVRKDMRGRYPKHYWPEDPFSAVATRRVRPHF